MLSCAKMVCIGDLSYFVSGVFVDDAYPSDSTG